MSTGISQVGFDPKVLEDEEEADYQQEEQEREQEIRNLIINELDDNLLDDENASFSSHDYRSTSNSRASQQLNDSDLQIKEWNSNEYADFPPRRGVFEKPPLMTGRANDFISQTGDKHQQPLGYMSYNQDDQQSRNYQTYDQEWQHPSNYMTYNQSTDQLPGGYNQHTHQLPIDYNQTSGQHPIDYNQPSGQHPIDYNQPSGQHPIDYNQPSGQHPIDYNQPSGQHRSSYSHENKEYQEYEEFGSYHGNSTDTNSNDGVTNQNKDQLYAANNYNQHTNYGDSYPTDGDGYYGGNQQEPTDSYQREASFPGNYRVQYVPGYRPQNTAHTDQEQRLQPGSSLQQYSPNTVWRDLRQGTTTDDHSTVDNKDNRPEQFVESTERTSNTAQLQILYQARGRKIEELSEKLNEREEELGRQIRVLNHQLVMLKDDHKGVSDSLSQSQEIVKDKQQEITTIQNKLNISIKDNELLNKEKQELLEKFNAANSTIDCFNEQLTQLSRADSLAKAREQHETILNTVRQRQEEEILRLKQKLDDSQVALNWKTEEANRLRGEVMEKADIINRLNRTLDDSQRQCQELLKTGTVTEITNLRTQLQDTISAKSKVDLNCTSLKSEINSLKEELVIYQNALKHGYGEQTSESFKGQDIVRNLNSENWSTPKTHGNDKQRDAISGLRKELEHSLSLNQTKNQTIKDLEKALEEATEELNEEKKKGERLEKIIVEQEVKVNDLKAQLSDKTPHDDPESDLVKTLQELKERNQGLKEKLAELEADEQQLSEDNLNLKTQMAEMVAEFDEDKRISLDKCRDACLQLHEDSKEQLRIQLDQEKELALKDLRDALQDSNDELLRVKESYLQLSEEFRNIESRVREELKESKDESQAVEAMKYFLEKQHALDIEKARKQWKDEHDVEVTRIVNEETIKIRKQANEEKAREIEKKLQEAETKSSQRDAIELDNRLSSAKKEWIQEQEQQMIDRITKAVEEARKTWHELQQKDVKEQIEKAINDAKKTFMESRDREVAQALSDAKVTWKKEEDEAKQREIEHEVEVAVTNAVAEAKQLWDKTNHEKGRIVHEQQAIESAVALAEVKWLEQEQVKISRAVDSAVHTAKSSWEHDKQREIARAVAEARHHWQVNQDEELNKALEEASAQLVDKFDEEKREAVEMALREAKTLWHRHHDQNNNANIEAIRNELWSEFEETKRKEVQETIEEERNRFMEEHEKEKQEEINRAIEYLESHYAKGLEEFKHKELRTVLSEARAEWEKEQESEVEEILKKRIDLARDDWFKSLDTSSRTEVDRALATAREAWAAEYEDELEDRVNAEITRIRENLLNEMEDSKRKEIDEAILTCRKQYESNERKLKDELTRLKVMGPPQSLRKHYENEISKLNLHHQKELEQLREEHDEHTRVLRESVEEEFDQKLVAVLHDAKQLWEDEQEEDRIQVEDQHKEKIKSVLENAREQFLKDQEKAVKAATETATNRQKELLKIEKETHKLTVERMKEELTKTKQKHEEQLQLVERKHADEMKTLTSALNDRKENGTQTPSNVESHSICDSSLGSLDQLTAMKTMHELRDSYLDTVAKIRDDVLDHVNQTKTNAAKKIRNEVLKERHSTAKKLRRYYLQCLKQLLEEDKASSDTRKTPSTIEEKLERMNQALNAVSPDSSKATTQTVTAATETYLNEPKEPKVSSPKEPYIIGAKKPHESSPKEPYITGHKDPRINGSKKPYMNGPKEPYIIGTKKPHESSPKEPYISGRGESYVNVPKELYIVGNKETYISVPDGGRIKEQSRPGGYGPDGASDSPRPSPSDKPQGFRELNHDVISQDTTIGSQTVTLWPEKDWTNKTTDQVTLSKPPSIQRRFAGSPALSVTSIESEYTDLPSVSRPSNKTNVAMVTPTSPTTSSKTKLDDVKARALARNNKKSVIKPISISATQRGTGTVRNLTNDNRGYKSRDKYIKNNSPLPSRPHVLINGRTSSTS